jgi:hypothetical protein
LARTSTGNFHQATRLAMTSSCGVAAGIGTKTGAATLPSNPDRTHTWNDSPVHGQKACVACFER